MNIENATLPEGVEPENVTLGEHPDIWDDRMLTEENIGYDSERGRAFNPQNGRWYARDGYLEGVFKFYQLSTRVGHSCYCAYEDCDGHADAVTDIELGNQECPACGAAKMGRAQFTESAKEKRERRSNISDRVNTLQDDFAEEMKRLQKLDVGTVPAMDYLMCSVGEVSLSEWAEARGVGEDTVKWNLREVADAQGEEVKYKK